MEMEIKMATLQFPMTDCYGTFEQSYHFQIAYVLVYLKDHKVSFCE